MAHKVLVGGFASGKRQMEKVARSLAVHYDEDVEAISFREAMTETQRLERMTRHADVITHSAGMVAIKGMNPESIVAIAPPVPVWAPFLAARAIASTTELALHSILPLVPPDEVDSCLRDGTAELALHLEGNLRWMGRIAFFDALRASKEARAAGIVTGLALMSHDRLFQSHPNKVEETRKAGVNVVIVPGAHEDFIKRPRHVLSLYEQGETTSEATGLIAVTMPESRTLELGEAT
jgi:hypothetical protein